MKNQEILSMKLRIRNGLRVGENFVNIKIIVKSLGKLWGDLKTSTKKYGKKLA